MGTVNQLACLTAPDFAGLPVDERNRVRAWVGVFEGIERGAGVTAQLVRAAAELGTSFGTVRRKYSAWMEAGRDWRVLADGRKLARAEKGLASVPVFVEFFRKLCEENQRCTAAAIRVLKRRWAAKLPIPGYEDFPGWPELPEGWTERNLRRHAPKQGDLLLSRKGVRAAAKDLGLVLRTRVGLWPGSHIQCDDVWHDHFVRCGNEVVRVLEFGALDVWSGCRYAWGSKPRRKKASGGHEGLSERDFRFFLASILWTHGYSARGTVLMLERGTAALRELAARMLYDLSGGLIRVETGAMHGETQALKGAWGGRAGGSGNFKSHLESLHNLLHNELGALPGQIGKDRRSAKESTHGLVVYQEKLLAWAEQLPAEIRGGLRHPLMDYHTEFCPVRDHLYGLINGRTDHELEGWEAMGRVETRYTLAPGTGLWLPVEEIPEVSRALVFSAATAEPERWTRRHRMSPAEVWQRGRGELLRASHAMIADLIGPDLARERKVNGSYVTIEDAEVSPEELIYEARIETPDGRWRELPRGERYGMLVNPFAPDWLMVLDGKGRCLGAAPRARRVCLADEEGKQRAMGRAAMRTAELLTPHRERWADEEAAVQDLRRHNAELGFGGASGRRDGGRIEAKEAEQRRGKEGAGIVGALLGQDGEDWDSPYLA